MAVQKVQGWENGITGLSISTDSGGIRLTVQGMRVRDDGREDVETEIVIPHSEGFESAIYEQVIGLTRTVQSAIGLRPTY